MDISGLGVEVLTPEEAEEIVGGDMYKAALFISGAFTAGFNFGYNVLGPKLFG